MIYMFGFLTFFSLIPLISAILRTVDQSPAAVLGGLRSTFVVGAL